MFDRENATMAFGGSCACGKITYVATATPRDTTICNCITCRKLSGGAFQAYTHVPAEKITYFCEREPTKLWRSAPDGEKDNNSDSAGIGLVVLRLSNIGERAYCKHCHTPLAMVYLKETDTIAVAVGSVDEETVTDVDVREALKPVALIFLSQKVWWCEVRDQGMRRLDRFSTGFEEMLNA